MSSRKLFDSRMIALVISHKKLPDITKTFKSLEDLGILVKDVTETTKSDTKEQRCEFLGSILSNLFGSILSNLFGSIPESTL